MGQGDHVGADRVLFVRINDVASAEFQQHFTPDIAVGIFDRGRIAEPDRLAVVADADVVLAVSREGVGGAGARGAESGRHDVADVRRDAVLEAFAEELDLVPAGAVCKGVESVVEGPVVKSDVHVFGKPIDDAVDLGERGAALEGDGMRVGHGEEGVEDPADPDVLLQNDGRPPGLGGDGPEYVGALAGMERQKCFSHGTCPGRRRTLWSSTLACPPTAASGILPGPRAASIVATVSGVTLFLPRYQRAESAAPAAWPANCSRRRLEVWTILTVMLVIRMVRLDALVWNTGAVGTWVLSLNRRAASAPWTWTVSPLLRAMASTTLRMSGRTVPTKRLVRGRTKTPRATRWISPRPTRRDSVRSTALREPCFRRPSLVKGFPFGTLHRLARTACTVDMA